MKRYEGCAGVSGWIISHLGWFIIIAAIGLLVLTLGGCKESKSKSSHSEEVPQTRLINPEWHGSTPAGIQLGANNSTIAQYEERWNKSWDNIEWYVLDDLFKYYKQYYCFELDWNCKNSNPAQLAVYIMPWDARCVDEESPDWPYEIYAYLQGHGWVCIDGWFPYTMEGLVIYIHFGDDPGVSWSRYRNDDVVLEEFYAFEVSAYSHELYHFFQAVAGLPVVDATPTDECGVIETPSPGDIVIHCPEVE